jgi:hypothetical protein
MRNKKVSKRFEHYRDLLVILTQREVKVRYKSTILGYVWSIAHPLAHACKAAVIYDKIRTKLFPTNTKGRLFAKIIFNALRRPKAFLKNLNKTNLKKFIQYSKMSEATVLEEKIRRKIDCDKGVIAKGQSLCRKNTIGHFENDTEKKGKLCVRLRGDHFASPFEMHIQEDNDYVPIFSPNIPELNIKLIAFYLPQFHPIPENDRFWGRGFTDWVNVAKAIPNFKGHYQPHIPTDLGFYDLRLPEVRELQAEMARQYGIYGFCYHHYWFNGRRLLERPFNEVLKSGKPDFPFCLCWANENWTRRWDGAEHEILLAQSHSREDDIAFIRDIMPAFRDERYIRINGKPLLIVYRANLLPRPKETAEIWRAECKEFGVDEIYLCAAQSFGITNPRPFGLDAAVEFPPHGVVLLECNEGFHITNPNFRGKIYNYVDVVNYMEKKKAPHYKLFRTVMPSWDNTPRRQNDSHIFANTTPGLYGEWLTSVLEYTDKNLLGDERLVFINAWNEWAESAYLEPDRKYGYAYLQATADALASLSVEKIAAK